MNGSRQQFQPEPQPAPRRDAALIRGLLGLLLALALLFPPAVGSAAALPLPWQQPPQRGMPAAAPASLAGLQEVAPPLAVQQLQEALADRQPVVEILSPQDGALLGRGPWNLRLRVQDWPLVDGGELGLGPHLMVQLDQDPPRALTTTEAELPELSPGSHRLTVYAALPWGEARSNPGAVRQIRLHRSAVNPLAIPQPGTPQLLAVSPPAMAGEEPLLLDFLLLDAPLQDVGGAGTQWRLRLNINGDDVLLDQQTPLWLRGWKPGLNALRLELLDGRGDPLNPPFNALVREVDRSHPPTEDRWHGPALTTAELAVLLGQAPAPAVQQPEPEGLPRPPEGATLSRPAGTLQAPAPAAATAPPWSTQEPEASAPAAGSAQTTSAPEPPAAPPAAAGGSRTVIAEAPDSPVLEEGAAIPIDRQAAIAPPALPSTTKPPSTTLPSTTGGRPAADLEGSSEAGSQDSDGQPIPSSPPRTPPSPEPAGPVPDADRGEISPARRDPDAPGELPPAPGASRAPAGAAAPPMNARQPEAPEPSGEPAGASVSPTPPAAAGGVSAGEQRISPGSSLSGRARDLVNADGTLRRPERRGPLAALRDRLQS